MTKIRISDDALADLNEGYRFYEAQDAGLGDYFSSCLRADIESLRITAGIHNNVYQDYHRLLSRVFPYGIFYTFENDVAIVWAVLDLRQDPDWIRERLNP
ncbi:MAG: type II toxin-antitoxin system RelE/ParE family toxin [Verrucomicrobiota bacterium]